MYLVKVTDFLKMEGVPDPHHVLRQKELLHQWQPGSWVMSLRSQNSFLFVATLSPINMEVKNESVQ